MTSYSQVRSLGRPLRSLRASQEVGVLILDTTYLLPLARIAIDVNLLETIVRGRADLKPEDVTVSLISVLGLQAKATKLNVPVKIHGRSDRSDTRSLQGRTLPQTRDGRDQLRAEGDDPGLHRLRDIGHRGSADSSQRGGDKEEVQRKDVKL